MLRISKFKISKINSFDEIENFSMNISKHQLNAALKESEIHP
jgi:hypothetical protein